ncbi:outer membrane beta-barrel protein [Kangiella sp. HZ709]|uniref:outer membrane beta-barrel protein n=1 Tax=Kangiella sp. HZ709 TaxID=2666328 RepID=UPI0012B02457|nr:outer membrane beta-barrel protein [Kangiella sp. HZ709]MRX28412.1 outer membrane beta-barrel protein [Kangiella sp. HZ709]
MTKKLITLLVAAAFTGTVSASDLSYDNFTIGYNQVDLDGASFDLDGFNLGASFSLSPEWYVKLDTLMSSGDEAGVDVDFDLTTVNFGYHMPMSNGVDFIAELGYVGADAEVSSQFGSDSNDDSGANLVLGFRGLATDNFEWGLNVQYADLDESSTFINLEGRYYFTDSFSLGVRGSFESDINIYGINARFDF